MNRLLRSSFVLSALLLATSCGDKPLTLEGYEKALAAAGVSIGPKDTEYFQMIGAKNGYGFSLKGDSRCTEQNLCRCEVFEWDTSIGSGRDALANIKKEGFMGASLMFNKNLGITCQGDSPQGKQAIAALMAM